MPRKKSLARCMDRIVGSYSSSASNDYVSLGVDHE